MDESYGTCCCLERTRRASAEHASNRHGDVADIIDVSNIPYMLHDCNEANMIDA